MLLAHKGYLGLLLLLTACIQPKQVLTQGEASNIEIVKSTHDPLYSAQAPKMVQYSQIKISRQPRFPAYPQAAKERGIKGEVLVEIWINVEGVPTRSVAIGGPGELREGAEQYCREWRFRPFLQEGVPIPVRFRVAVSFGLQEENPFNFGPREGRPFVEIVPNGGGG